MKPRSTLLTVVEIKKPEERTSEGLIIPASVGREYSVCKIVAVGDGGVTHKDELSACADLKPGQEVLVKLMASRQMGQGMTSLSPIGLNFKDEESGQDIVLIEQTQVVIILAEPEDDASFTIKDNDIRPYALL